MWFSHSSQVEDVKFVTSQFDCSKYFLGENIYVANLVTNSNKLNVLR